MLMLALLVSISFFGRRLQSAYPQITDLIPYFGAAFLLAALLVTLRAASQHGLPTRKRLWMIAGWLTVLVLTIAILSEKLIALPIEHVHFLKFGALAFFLFYSQTEQTPLSTRLVQAASTAAVVGFLEETLQLFVPNRYFDWRDIALNWCGSGFGTLLAWITTLWIEEDQ